MHPILFRIPLPHVPLKLWWGLALVAVVSLGMTAFSTFKRERGEALGSAIFAIVAAGAAWRWRTVAYDAPSLPIYIYGAMLSLSLIVGWYLSLTLADKDGLPKETMANCYVVTAFCAVAGSRLLYAINNPDEFHSVSDLLAIRNGGLVAYGGFIGGLLASWAFLAPRGIRLLAWADDAVPSLASGLVLTRIGCYLFGCDFGKRLPDAAPHWLKTLGTFPHWPPGTLASGDGSPAFVRHLELYRGGPLEGELLRMNTSFPVHPTQLYESLVGAALLGLLLWQRRHVRFRGQVFFLFVFAYGFLRFLLELWRDDTERGSYPPTIDEHVFIPLCLLLFAVAFTFGISQVISNVAVRTSARVVAFVIPVAAYFALRPAPFAPTVPYQLSTSQIIGLVSALTVAYFYARFWADADKHPDAMMSLGTFARPPSAPAASDPSTSPPGAGPAAGAEPDGRAGGGPGSPGPGEDTRAEPEGAT